MSTPVHNPQPDTTLFVKLLKQHGASMTKQRRAVFELLHNSEPQTMQQLHSRSKGSVDRVSLYRIIELFESAGIVERIAQGWKYKLELSDLFRPHHHHMTCLSCGALIATEEDQRVEELVHQMAATYGFTATKHQIEIQGYCKNCACARTPQS